MCWIGFPGAGRGRVTCQRVPTGKQVLVGGSLAGWLNNVHAIKGPSGNIGILPVRKVSLSQRTHATGALLALRFTSLGGSPRLIDAHDFRAADAEVSVLGR